MANNIFRKKPMERIKSPEQLDRYLRVTTPGVWIVLFVVLIFLGGIIYWSVAGRIESTVPATALVHDKEAVVTLDDRIAGTVKISGKEIETETDARGLKEGTVIKINGERYTSYEVEVKEEDKTTTLRAQTDLPDGEYEAEVVTESIRPMSFLVGDDINEDKAGE